MTDNSRSSTAKTPRATTTTTSTRNSSRTNRLDGNPSTTPFSHHHHHRPSPPAPSSTSSTTATLNLDNMKSEQVRLNSFTNQLPSWPVSFIRPEDCAKAGFFFLRDGDKVQCAFCRGVAGEWEVGDNPSIEHKRHFPRCPFIRNLPVGNIPIGEGQELARARLTREQQINLVGVDVCGPFEPPILRPYAGPDQVHVRGAQPLRRGETPGDEGCSNSITELAIRTGDGPARKHLVTAESRFKTFENWPVAIGQSPKTMSEAGFYYIGFEDHVKCFYCDGGLRNWEPQDDPWVEHARWFSNCPFVLLNKGVDYVKGIVVEAHPPIKPEHTPSCHQQQHHSRLQANDRVVSDDEVKAFIETQIVQSAVEMGVSIDGIQSAIRHKLQRSGIPFESTEELLEAVLGHDDGEYWSDTESSSADDDECITPGELLNGADQRVPSAGAAVNSEERPAGRGIRNSSGSEDEEVAAATVAAGTSRVGLGTERLRTGSNSSDSSSSASGGEKCSSPGADSGKYSMSNGSEEDEEAQSKKAKGGDKKNVPATLPVLNLEEEVRKLKEARQCKICMDKEADVVFLPCGHLISCVSCATALSTCALCRQKIKAVVRTYIS